MNDECNEAIGLKSLFFEFLKHWRWIIITAIISGVLFGGIRIVERLQYRDSISFLQQSELYYESAKLQYEREKNIYEEEIEELYGQLNEVNDYYNNSYILKINPYKKNVASADIFISVSSEDAYSIQSLLDASISYFNDGRAAEAASEKAQINSKYIQDIICVRRSEDNGTVLHSKTSEGQTINSPVTVGFHVSVMGENEEFAISMLQYILANYENEFSKEISDQISPHTINTVYQGNLKQWDDGLKQMKNNILNMRYDLEKEIKTRERLLADLIEPKIVGYPNDIVFLSGFKYMLLGSFLGGIIGVAIAFFKSYYSDKMVLIQELQHRLGGKTLLVSWKRDKRGIAKKIDFIINDLQYKAEAISEDVAVNLMESIIKQEKLVMTLGIISNVNENISMYFQENLKETFPKCQILLLPDILNNVQSVNDLEKCDWIMLLEDVNKTSNKSVDKKRQLVICKNRKIDAYLMLY